MRILILATTAAAVFATPLLAGPPVKRQYCQVPRTPARDVRREPCRKPPVPPVIDRTPMYFISTDGRPATTSTLT
jgi:hypothetical protein